MAEKLYVSQWLKVGANLEHWDKVKAQAAAIPMLADAELDLLFQLVETEDRSVAGLEIEDLLRMMHAGLKPAKTANLFIAKKQNALLRKYISLSINTDNAPPVPKAQIVKALKYFIKNNDYDNLLLLGRHIVMFKRWILKDYVEAILGKWSEYKYGEGGPANPVSCLVAMGPEVTQQVEDFLKVQGDTVPDAKRRWEESRKKLGV